MPRQGRNPARTNHKRTRLIQNLSKGMNIAEAARASGYETRQAAHISLKRMRMYLPEILARLDLPVDKVLRKFGDQLEAKETKFFADKGVVIETREVQAHDIQHRAAVRLAEIYGCSPRNSHDDGDGSRPPQITINLAFLGPERAAEVLAATRESDSEYGGGQPVLDEEGDEDKR